MKKFEFVGIASIVLLIIMGVFNATKKGYRSSNSMILARSITLSSSLDGKVINELPHVGDKVDANELLVSLKNSRIDKSRLVDYQSQLSYLSNEILAVENQQEKLQILFEQYNKKAIDYKSWMIRDINLQKNEFQKQLNESKKISQLKINKSNRYNKLYKSNLVSNANQQIAIAEAEIAKTNVEISKSQLSRSYLKLATLNEKGVFFEDGETSYWEKMLDTIELRQFDITVKLDSLKLELIKLEHQEREELKYVKSNHEEKIKAPFSGIISSLYVNNETNVVSGTNLLQILDCSNPVIVIPIPEHKIGSFRIGMKVTITPVDSNVSLKGRINYISSGPLLANDSTMVLQNDMTVNGNKAIVSLVNSKDYAKKMKTCDSARKAIVVVHT